MSLKLNLGCREDVRPGYENIDLYFEHPDVLKLDVRKLDYPKGSVDEIVADSVLEHLTFQEGEEALRLWFSFIKPGGTFNMKTPDFDTTIATAARLGARHLAAQLYGDWKEEGQWHKSCWQKKNIIEIANECGLELIEDGRWLDDLHLVFRKNG